MFQGIIVIFICVFLFFHKGITRQIVEEAGIATKADIEELRKELKEEIRSMKENDLFHINMAILLLARDAAKSEDRFNRIYANRSNARKQKTTNAGNNVPMNRGTGYGGDRKTYPPSLSHENERVTKKGGVGGGIFYKRTRKKKKKYIYNKV